VERAKVAGMTDLRIIPPRTPSSANDDEAIFQAPHFLRQERFSLVRLSSYLSCASTE
jgi:hypothetical protein